MNASQLQQLIDNVIDSHDNEMAQREEERGVKPSPNDDVRLESALKVAVRKADIPIASRFRDVAVVRNDEDDRELRFSRHVQHFLDNDAPAPPTWDAEPPKAALPNRQRHEAERARPAPRRRPE